MVSLGDFDVFRRKVVIFRSGVLLMFFTSMSKILVPGAVFDSLQHEQGFDASLMAGLASFYMYSYAFSQLALGMLADRFGGVRILLLGGGSFCIGMTMFPLCSSYWLLLIFRVLSGFGAGIVFLGVAKLVADLYPDRFSSVLGITLLIGYLGPVTGTSGMVWLVAWLGWRASLLVPAVLSTVAYLVIVYYSRGKLKPIERGGSLWGPVFEVMRRWDVVRLFVASSMIFGSYYALLTLMGRKCLEDVGGFSMRWASLLVTMLTILVASHNYLGDRVCRLFRNQYGRLMRTLSAMSLLGACLGWLTLRCGLGGFPLILSYVLIAIPAGFFPVYGTMAKESCPSNLVALSVALLNFWAFVMIAIVGDIAGRVMRSYEWMAEKVGDVLVYPPSAYEGVFAVFIVVSLVGLSCTIGLFSRRVSR